ncbi:malate dehydrogenase (oxaloacetate-decarboxylating) [Peptoniphilus koenoeneniae]|uniref:Malate dehydrogenase (Oxaloacetate-decarboxylating) n=1 Tax=Peptoniphilus koenoeneniae TaxID=507751 RepID=A0ABU0AUT6_9FIRM|nr:MULTISPECIES: NADP-dependent malic enzyme [Peptoniphilus]ERT57339.1 putative NAD-dependent malic enzyme [Peptoniphilus sp. BV3C26]MDQ0275021.1 malate dehydrogenase (oxaloacetate-decarboxylating) [Peptoniphilus koenoeneniae]
MDNKKEAMKLHRELRGKFEIKPRAKTDNAEVLALAYTPGVAEACLAIKEDPHEAYNLTRKWNLVGVVTDGTAVLGLGDIGAMAGMPVMEGKSILFKNFANVDAFPICLATKDTEEIIKTVKNLEPTFGGINLEDIKAPKCFEIEQRLAEEMDIPVFHDDQHGTAIVVIAAILNSLKLVGKKLEDTRIVMSGAGAAGMAILHLLTLEGAKNVIFVGRKGIIGPDYYDDEYRQKMLSKCNPENVKGGMAEALTGADIFIGVSGPGLVTKEMVEKMNKDAIVFAMANPVPEIYPEEAKKGGARICGTGRSDFPNQVNNVSVFPGLFRGALDVRARKITDNMKLAAAHAIADAVENPIEERVLPDAFDLSVAEKVAKAVADQARKDGVARE